MGTGRGMKRSERGWGRCRSEWQVGLYVEVVVGLFILRIWEVFLLGGEDSHRQEHFKHL